VGVSCESCGDDDRTRHRARLAGLDKQRAQREAERATVAAEIGRLNAVIPVLRERVAMRRTLYEKEYGSKLTWLEVQQELIEREQQLAVQRSRQAEADAALAAVIESRRQVEAEFRRVLLGEFTQAEQKAAALAQELVKAAQRTALQVLRAPVDGVVQQLQVHTIGGVVTPAERLMVLVPAETRLEVEATVQNRDIGFVAPGQAAEIKIDTFNFTKYGLIRGEVVLVSRDAVGRDRPGDVSDPRATEGAAIDGQNASYAARISLHQGWMQIEDRRIELCPGMAVTAEIKTGSRKLIEYVLSPLMRYRQETGRER
jgi:hemolysin D